MHDIVEFLHLHPPFDDLDEATLEELARTVEVEFFAAGATIFRQGDEPMKHVRVVRRGTVELVDRGLALGSHGRRELAPSSDADSALAWEGDHDDPGQREYMQALGGRVVEQLAATGFTADTHGATCAQPLFQRSVDLWRHLIRSSIEDPTRRRPWCWSPWSPTGGPRTASAKRATSA